ncbi:MAG: hypothetical protein V2J55_01390 [Candidatus Competibacteraceae bacterium]|jgi:hypothetical protein|nr:hypothetical protein [Candidatus Competibacteraceae bacterium]
MHALFFDIRPKPSHLQHCFDQAERLRPTLAQHKGLRFLDRYSALGSSDLLLSHRLGQNEDTIIA